MKKTELTRGVYIIDDFLSQEECDDLIRFSEEGGLVHLAVIYVCVE